MSPNPPSTRSSQVPLAIFQPLANTSLQEHAAGHSYCVCGLPSTSIGGASMARGGSVRQSPAGYPRPLLPQTSKHPRDETISMARAASARLSGANRSRAQPPPTANGPLGGRRGYDARPSQPVPQKLPPGRVQGFRILPVCPHGDPSKRTVYHRTFR